MYTLQIYKNEHTSEGVFEWQKLSIDFDVVKFMLYFKPVSFSIRSHSVICRSFTEYFWQCCAIDGIQQILRVISFYQFFLLASLLVLHATPDRLGLDN